MFEVEYGCNVQNKFEDCGEASDPFELLSAQSKSAASRDKKSAASKRSPRGKAEEAKPQRAAREPVVVPAQAKASVAAEPAAGDRQAESGRGGAANRGRGRGGPRRRVVDGRVTYDTVTFRRGGRGGRYVGDRSNFPARPTEQTEEAGGVSMGGAGVITEEAPRRPYRGGRGFGGARFGYGGGADGGGGRRVMDRHSGNVKTGIRAEEKRRGAGAHNWGKPTEILDVAEGEQQADTSATEQPATASSSKENAEQKEPEQRSRSPSPVLMTLDEYREQQRKKRLQNKHEGRKAGEGEDPSRWAKPAVVYHKKPEEKLKYTMAEEYDQSSEEEESQEEEEEEDERTKFEKTVTSKMFVTKPAVVSSGGRRGGRYEGGGGYRDDIRGGDSGKPGRGDNASLEIRRGRGGQRGAGGGFERRQPPQQHVVEKKPPDLSEFPELC